MSHENVELARRANALMNAGAYDALFELFDPNLEWRDLMHAPDVPEVLQGREAVRLMMTQWTQVYDEFGVEVYEYVDAHPWVVCDARWYGKGKGSDVPIEVRSADAYEFRDGLVARTIGGYPDVASALEDVPHE